MKNEYYLLTDDAGVVIGVGSSNVVPEDGVNVDGSTYETASKALGAVKWQDGELVPITLPLSIPARVSRRQFRLQLDAAQLFDKVTAWIAGQDRATQIAYEDSDGFNRNEPRLQEAFAAMGYTSSQIDDFFVKASQR